MHGERFSTPLMQLQRCSALPSSSPCSTTTRGYTSSPWPFFDGSRPPQIAGQASARNGDGRDRKPAAESWRRRPTQTSRRVTISDRDQANDLHEASASG